MNIPLNPHVEDLIKQKVDSGLYASASDVIQNAIRALEELEKLQALRKDIQDGLNSGEPTPLDMEDVIRRGQERLAAKKRSS